MEKDGIAGTRTLYEAAQSYVAQGLSIVPQLSGTERKEPPRGFPLAEFYAGRKATVSELEEWFKNKKYNIACIVGFNSLRYWDIDDLESVSKGLAIDGMNLVKSSSAGTFVNKTFRGYGIFFYDDQVPNDLGNIDFRKRHQADKGTFFEMELLVKNHLVTLPPSKHFTGVTYQNIGQPTIGKRPHYVLDLIEQAKRKGWPGSHVSSRMTDEEFERLFRLGAAKGNRNQAAFNMARWLLFKWKLDPKSAFEELEQWNARNSPPLDIYELRAAFKSAFKYSMSEKRKKSKGIILRIEKEETSTPRHTSANDL